MPVCRLNDLRRYEFHTSLFASDACVGQIKESAWLQFIYLNWISFESWSFLFEKFGGGGGGAYGACVCVQIYSILIESWIISQHHKIVET